MNTDSAETWRRGAVVATTDPKSLPIHSVWYLTTNLPLLRGECAQAEGALPVADIVEVVRLYGLRMWAEQSDKQVKTTLGWAQYQVRSDIAMRRHRLLACLAFSSGRSVRESPPMPARWSGGGA